MSALLAVLVVAAFVLLLGGMGLVDRAREAGSRASSCLRVLRDGSLDDRSKERALQGHAIRLFGLFGLLAGGGALSLLIPLAGVWALDRADLASLPGVLAVLERPDFLVGATVVGSVGWLVSRRRARP